MNEIIRITEKNGQRLVSARDLHCYLEIITPLSIWFPRMQEYGFEEGKDFITILLESSGGRPSKDYGLTIDCAKEISMLQRTERGKQARQYFIECEKQLQKKQGPQTYIEALKALVEAEEQKLLLENKVENLETALDSLVEWVSIIKVCQHNKIKESVINWRLLKSKSTELGYMIKKAQSPRYGYQNLYHVNVFRAVYPQYNYQFLD